MKVVLFALAFLIVCAGIAVIAAIPLLIALSNRINEIAQAISVHTQFNTHRYNYIIRAHMPPPPPPSRPQPTRKVQDRPRDPVNVIPIRGSGKDGSVNRPHDHPRQ